MNGLPPKPAGQPTRDSGRAPASLQPTSVESLHATPSPPRGSERPRSCKPKETEDTTTPFASSEKPRGTIPSGWFKEKPKGNSMSLFFLLGVLYLKPFLSVCVCVCLFQWTRTQLPAVGI